jgi:hypothetical protein
MPYGRYSGSTARRQLYDIGVSSNGMTLSRPQRGRNAPGRREHRGQITAASRPVATCAEFLATARGFRYEMP